MEDLEILRGELVASGLDGIIVEDAVARITREGLGVVSGKVATLDINTPRDFKAFVDALKGLVELLEKVKKLGASEDSLDELLDLIDKARNK